MSYTNEGEPGMGKMKKGRLLCWVDLETTGTDENADPIIEIGLVITEANFPFAEIAQFTAVASQPEGWKDRMVPVVTEMHTTNGLIADVDKSTTTLATIEAEVVALLASYGEPTEFMLAGSGVAHFDRRFIAAQMPAFNEMLWFPMLDVGILRRALAMLGLKALTKRTYGSTFGDGAKAHRGLDDIKDHLNEIRTYGEALAPFIAALNAE